ncbi:MAG: hypothetical protein V2A54_03895, partial [Bacteroidota bacterium]
KEDFEKVMSHIHLYHKYCSERGKTLGISITPMRINWQEIPGLVAFCNNLNASIYFSFVEKPENLALWNLDVPSLEEIYRTYVAHDFTPATERQKINKHYYQDLINQVKFWIDHHESANFTASPAADAAQTNTTISSFCWPEAMEKVLLKFAVYIENSGDIEGMKKSRIENISKKLRLMSDIIHDNTMNATLFNKLFDMEINEMILAEIEQHQAVSLAEKAKYFLLEKAK